MNILAFFGSHEVIYGGVISCFNPFLQLSILLLLSPSLFWILEYFPSSFCGKSVPSLGAINLRAAKEFIEFLRYHRGIAARLSFANSVILFLLLPSFSLFKNEVGHGGSDDIMFLGAILFFAMGCLKLYPPFPVFFTAILLLCLGEAIVFFAVPGVNGFSGIAEDVHLLPDSGIIGVSICYGLAFMILAPLPRVEMLEEKWWQISLFDRAGSQPPYKETSLLLMMFLQTGWLVFLSDLFLPEFLNADGFLSLFGFILRIMLVLGSMMVISFLGIERNLRIISLLVALGILLALAGRFAV